MFNYLYYKLYKASRKSALKDTAEFTATIYFGGLISANILVISAFMAKINVLPFLYSDKKEAGLFAFILVVISSIYFLSNKRYKDIIKIYSQETETERKRGNAIVAVYVALSFLLIFAVALYKPGKL